MGDDGNTIKLQHPIKWGTETIAELTLRAPKAKDFRTFPMAPTMGDILDFAGRLCAQPSAVIDELSAPDMMALMELVSHFLPVGPAIGSAS